MFVENIDFSKIENVQFFSDYSYKSVFNEILKTDFALNKIDSLKIDFEVRSGIFFSKI